MEIQVWLSELDEVAVGPSEITMMGADQGAVVLMGDAEERHAWLKKVAEAMECEVKPMTPQYPTAEDKARGWWVADPQPDLHGAPCTPEQYINGGPVPDTVDEALFRILREDQTHHWMGKPRD